ncbi:hypothetical protein BZG78_10260 [Salinivibrio sp. MA351]|uniref:hypothetical protein n=1 Tax=Salinivibrio sp. MA351 TaxID=1909453 RepID=UPI0009894758|nr:hypothetical protein [Salinivibrio sp. MA351]OOE97999.1 hypothetical protein BZG78_10260 [Salinivibrio sp. MA351]
MSQEQAAQKEQRGDEESVTDINGLENESSPDSGEDSPAQIRQSIYFDSEKYKQEAAERRKRMYLLVTFTFAFMVLVMASVTNPGIYKIDPETLITINQAFNAIVLLAIPFLLGSIGAVARILMSGLLMVHSGTLVISSGLMAMFSWVGIKSGVLLAIVAPHLEDKGVSTSITAQAPSDFYTMALVAILVGMFSTNLYLFINQRVEYLTQQASHSSKSPNTKSQSDA